MTDIEFLRSQGDFDENDPDYGAKLTRLAQLRWAEGLSDSEAVDVAVRLLMQAESDGDLWLVGDGILEEAIAERGLMHAVLTRVGPDVAARLVGVMKRAYASEGRHAGFWSSLLPLQ